MARALLTPDPVTTTSVAAAQRAYDAAEASHRETARQLAEAEALCSPHRLFVSRDARLAAQERIPGLRQAVADRTAALAQTRHALAAAQDAQHLATLPPTLAALTQAVTDAAVRHRALRDEARQIAALISPYVDRDQTPSRVEFLRAKAREPEVRRDLALAEAELEEAESALAVAQDAERQAERARAYERLQPYVPRLDRALTEAAAILVEMVPLDQAARCGITDTWGLLLDEGPSREGMLAMWRRYCKEHEML